MEIHVRELIKYLDYNELVKNAVIPDDIFVVESKSFAPKWVGSRRSEFGVLVDLLMGAFIGGLNARSSNVFNIVKSYNLPFQEKDIDSSTKLWWKIYHFVKKLTKNFPGLEYQAKITDSGLVVGHPDLKSETTVLDIKTTVNFRVMRVETILQIVAYAAICSTKTIGVVLPLLGLVVTHNVSLINLKAFREAMTVAVSIITSPIAVPFVPDYYGTIFDMVGSHIHKEKNNLEAILRGWYPQKRRFTTPSQFFLSSPRRMGFCKFSETDLKASKSFVEEYGIPIFIHAPYIINLAKLSEGLRKPLPAHVEKSQGLGWDLQVLKHELNIASKIGARGVVIHLGVAGELEEWEAYHVMLESIDKLLPFIKSGTPLLIETGCGEGTEIATHLDIFYDLISQYPPEKIGVCVDTCHVFASGAYPMNFLTKMGDRVKLIHYNDSAKPQGCHADIHAPAGTGYIGGDIMVRILCYAIEHNIPCVIE